jgi:hypothetical protein
MVEWYHLVVEWCHLVVEWYRQGEEWYRLVVEWYRQEVMLCQSKRPRQQEADQGSVYIQLNWNIQLKCHMKHN